MSGGTDPDAVTVVETRAVRGSIAYGIDAETREPVAFTAQAATLRDFAAALEEGIPYVVALVPAWAVVPATDPALRPFYDPDTAKP